MLAPFPDPSHDRQPTRRRVFIGAAASVLCTPAIVRAANVMPVRGLIMPIERPYAGFVQRLFYHWCDQALKKGPKGGYAIVGTHVFSEDQLRRIVWSARLNGNLR